MDNTKKRKDLDHETTPRKRQKSQQKYRPEYTKEWPVLQQSSVDSHHVFCSICRVDFCVGHGGRNDCQKHIKTKKHCDLLESQDRKAQSSIAVFFPQNKDKSVIKAELLFTDFLVEHNVPLSVADHAGPIFKAMFADSEIAKKYGCGRTKTGALVEALATEDANVISEAMKSDHFSIATDGSNDIYSSKLYPVTVRYFDKSRGCVSCVVLSLLECDVSSTGKNIYNLMDQELTRRGLSWEKCVSFGADNASVMQGLKSGVAHHLLKANPNMYIVGCACHLMHLAAQSACRQLPISLDELLVDIFYYIDKSSNRKQAVQQFQNLCNKDNNKILKHVSTRWLSLGQCLQRLLEQWEPLLEFFKAEFEKSKPKKDQQKSKQAITPVKPMGDGKSTKAHVSKTATTSKAKTPTSDKNGPGAKEFDLSAYIFKQTDIAVKAKQSQEKKKDKAIAIADHSELNNAFKSTNKVERVTKLLKNPHSKLYALFLTACLPVFDTGNQILQRDEPVIHKVHYTLTEQLRELLMHFIKPSVLVKFKDNLHKIPYDDAKMQKEDKSLFIGSEATKFLEGHENKLDVPSFYSSVRKFYVNGVKYMVHKFPYEDGVLINAAVSDIQKRIDAQYSSVLFFTKRFPTLVIPSQLDQLQQEFMRYQVYPLPDSILNTRNDSGWGLIGQLKDGNGHLQFSLLTRVMLAIQVIFHSNADCERVFSYVRKTKTEFRPKLQTPTLSSLIVHKVFMTAKSSCCYQQKYSDKLLTKAKSATYNKLRKPTNED